jgi:hypothetical protein
MKEKNPMGRKRKTTQEGVPSLLQPGDVLVPGGPGIGGQYGVVDLDGTVLWHEMPDSIGGSSDAIFWLDEDG